MTYLTTGLVDAGREDIALESAACKVFGTETLWQTVNDAMQCAGGNGFTTDYPYERMLRDARVNMIFEGTNEILRLMIAGQGLIEPGRRLSDAASGGEQRYARRANGAEAPEPMVVPAALQSESLALSIGIADLAQTAAAALRAHGRAVSERQLVLAPLADQAIALYAQAAVLSRASATVDARGEERSADELLLARGACRRLSACARQSVAALRDGDELLMETASLVRRHGGLPGEPA
jgi:acyl-CoA dehydrogenase family protein 9